MFKKNWIMCSKFIYYSRFNTKHNWGDHNNYFNEHEKLHLDNIKDIHMSFKNNKANAYGCYEPVVLLQPLHCYFGMGMRMKCDGGVGDDLAHINSRKNKHGIIEANKITSN